MDQFVTDATAIWWLFELTVDMLLRQQLLVYTLEIAL